MEAVRVGVAQVYPLFQLFVLNINLFVVAVTLIVFDTTIKVPVFEVAVHPPQETCT
jgi:hypothetical protein